MLSLKAATGNDTWTGAAGDNNWNTTGNWTGANTPPTTGDTPVFGSQGAGSLTLNNDITGGSFLGLTFNANAPSFTLNGNSITTTGGIVDNSINLETINNMPIAFDSSHSVSVVAGGSLAINSVISGTGTFVLTKNGGGTLTLTGKAAGANTFGPTTISAGTLTLDFSQGGSTPAANIITNAALTLGGGKLNIIGAASATIAQTNAGVTFASGASAITVASGASGTAYLTLGAITRNTASTVKINLPTSGSVNSSSGTASTVLTGTGSTPYSYVMDGNGNIVDFGAKDSGNTFIGAGKTVASAAYSSPTASGNQAQNAQWGTAIIDFVNNGANTGIRLSGSTGIGTITGARFNSNRGGDWTIDTSSSGRNFQTGGVLVTTNVGPWNVNFSGPGGMRQSTANADFLLVQDNILGEILWTGAGLTTGSGSSATQLIKAGRGTVNCTTSSGYTGQTYINEGTLAINQDGGVGATGTGAAVNLNGGTLLGTATFTLDNAGANIHAVNLGNNGGGLGAAATFAMTVDGVISGATGTGPLTIGIPASVANGNVAGLVPGTGTGTENTAINATGTVILSGANTFTGGAVLQTGTGRINGINALGGANYGGLTFNGGTLQYSNTLSSDSDLSTGNGITLSSGGGTLDVNGNAVTLANPIGNGGSGALTVKSTAANGSLTLSGANNYTGGTIVSNGTLLVNNLTGSGTGSGTVTLNGGTTTDNGIIGGNVTVNSGATLGGTGVISGAVTLNTGGTLTPTSTNILTLNNTLTLNGGLCLINFDAGLNTNGIIAASGALTLTSGGIQVNITDGTLLNGTYKIIGCAGTPSGSVNNLAVSVVSGSVQSGSAVSLQAVSGALNLVVAPYVPKHLTWQGDGSLNKWDLAISADWTNGATPTVFNNNDIAVLDDSSANQTVNLTGALSPGSVTVNGTKNYTLASTGKIGGSAALTNNGSGTLTVLTTNDYNGGTVISAGTVQVGNGTTAGGAIGSGAVQDNSALVFNLPTGSQSAIGAASGSGTLTMSGSGTLVLNGADTLAGATTITAGTLKQGAASVLPNGGGVGDTAVNGTLDMGGQNGTINGLTGSGTIDNTVAGSPSLTVTGNGTFSGVIKNTAGTLALNMNGSGKQLTLSGTNTYSGGTTITAGTIQLGNSNSVSSGDLNVLASANLDLNGFSTTVNGLSGGGTVNSSVAGTMTFTIGNSGNGGTFSGAIQNSSGTVNLAKNGAGTEILTGNNTYSGATTINAGILRLDSGGIINGTTGGGLAGGAGAQLVINGGSYSGTTFNLAAPSAGLLVSSGSITLSGALTANNGNSSQASTDAPIIANGGTLTAASLSMGRTAQSATTQPAAGYTASGIYVNGGAVNISGNVSLGTQQGANSTASARIDSGSLNVTGTLAFGLNNGGRWSVVDVNGGTLTVGDTTTGMTLGSTFAGHTEFLMRAGTATVGKISFGQGTVVESNILQQIGGTLYIGSGGMAQVSTGAGSGDQLACINLSAGILGATADWSNAVPINLTGTNFTIQAGDASGTAHDIKLTGVLFEYTNTTLIKSGLGTLTLSGANQQNGGTVISNGTLNINGIFALGGANYNGLSISNNSTLQYSTNSTGNGSLDLTSIGTAGLTFGSGVNTIDVNGNSVTYAGSIGNGGIGSLTLQSTLPGGVLNLLTNNNYTGNTLVGSGATLKVNNTNGSATGPGNVTVASGGTLGGIGIISGAVEIQSGGILAPGNSVGTNTVGALTLDSGAVINTEFNGSGHDTTVVTGGLTVNGGIFNLFSEGSTAPWTTTGSFKLIQYGGADPSLDSSWTTSSSSNPHVGNPQTSLKYAFTASGGYLTLAITLSGSAVAGSWTNDANGSWAAGANWDSNPSVPHAAGDLATFGTGTALRTVTLDGSKAVGTITFNNNNSFHIAPGSGGTLTLDKNGSGATVFVTGGAANQIQTPVALNDNATVAVNSGKSLAVSGNIHNSSAIAETLTVNQPGTLALSGNNSYGPGAGSSGTILTGSAIVQVGHNNALGAGDVSFAGNGTLQAGAVGLTVGNNIDISPGMTATVDTAGQTLSLNGALNDSGSLTKIGNGTLALPDNVANSFTGITTVNGGVLSVAYEGDLYQSTQIILNGGYLLGNGQSDNGYQVVIDPPIGIGPTLGAVGGTALVDATSGSTLTLANIITSAGNSGANNLVVNNGAGNNGTVYMGVDGNTYNGTTVISNGLLWVASSLPLASSTLNYDNQGGVLVVDGGITSITLGGLSGSQNFGLTNLSGSALSLTVGNNNGSTTYSGNLSDPAANGGLTKVGTGTLTLAGTNSYILPTTISAGVLRINTNGVLNTISASVPSVGGAQLVVSGGTLTVTNSSNIGTPSAGLLVSSGSATFLGPLTTTLNVNNGNLIAVTGGSLQAASLSLGRTALSLTTQPVAGSTTAGLYVNGGAVDILGNLDMGITSAANSSANTRIDSGSLTVGGVLTIGENNGSRWSAVDVNGGSLTVTNATTGISVGGPLSGNAELLIRAGTVTAGIIGLGQATLGSTNMTAVINMTNGSLYVGSGGIVQVSTGAGFISTITLKGGILGATANWSSTNDMQLGNAAIQAADASANPWNIGLSGVLSGTNLVKTGAGTLTLSGVNTYTGTTTISNGTLALTGPGSIATTPQVSIAAGATFDVSALAGYTFTGASPVQTLAGASGFGTANVNATGNTLTLASGANGLLNAIGDGSPTVGKITVAGGLALNGNTITVNVGGGILGAGTYRLLDCTGTLSGSANTTPAFTGLGATPGATASVSTTAGAAGHVDLTVGKATPILQSATASTITNGSPLSASILSVTFTNTAGSNVLGSAVFTSPATIPPVGTAGYQVQFTPNDTADYNTPAAFNVNVTVLPSTLVPTQSAGITGFSMTNGNVVINGTNGQSGGTYYLLESTNLADSISQWKAVATNVVSTNGPSGAFTFTGTNTVNSGAAQQFYILSNTNN